MAGDPAGTRSRPRPERPGGRRLRAAVFTLLSSALAVAGHHLAAGDPVPWERVAAGSACAFVLSWSVTRRPPPWWQVVTATGVAQLVLHRALSVRQPVHHGHAAAHGVLPDVVRTAHHSPWAMPAAHCVAAVVMALLMYHADQVLSRLPETVGRWAEKAVAAVAAVAAAFGALRGPARGAGPGSCRYRLTALPYDRRWQRCSVTRWYAGASCRAGRRRSPDPGGQAPVRCGPPAYREGSSP